jgi:hypothetical protein
MKLKKTAGTYIGVRLDKEAAAALKEIEHHVKTDPAFRGTIHGRRSTAVRYALVFAAGQLK